MAEFLLRTDKEIAEIYGRHRETVYRVCFAYMKNHADTEDSAQETFYKMIRSGAVFNGEEHEKAWLIRTAANVCKDSLRSRWRARENIEDYGNLCDGRAVETDETLDAVMSLPDKYKSVIYLYYYEGYDSVEISKILKKPQSTVRYYLLQARKILRDKLGGEFYEE